MIRTRRSYYLSCILQSDTEEEDEHNKDLKIAFCLYISQNGKVDYFKNMVMNELSFLDATYKTTRYALPIFFIVVKTNVDYQDVGTFVCEGESTENFTEAKIGILGGNCFTV